MQTIQLDQKLLTKAMHQMPASRVEPLPMPPMPSAPGVIPGLIPGATAAHAPRQSAQPNPFADMDAMLIRDPNVGAVHGLRFALLFNAGLALSGLVVWELWTLLAA